MQKKRRPMGDGAVLRKEFCPDPGTVDCKGKILFQGGYPKPAVCFIAAIGKIVNGESAEEAVCDIKADGTGNVVQGQPDPVFSLLMGQKHGKHRNFLQSALVKAGTVCERKDFAKAVPVL